MTFKVGPFTLYRVEKDGTLDISLTCFGDAPFGWEYGWRDDMRGTDRPWVEFRVGKLMAFYFQKFEKGFELWFMGFWWII